MKEYIFTAPLWIRLAKSETGKKYHINLNNYHNWHFSTRNNIKIQYQVGLRQQLNGLKFGSKVKLAFKLIRGDNIQCDRANILCLHEKFFCDAMVQYGCLPDDNNLYIEETTYRSGPVDKENPRVEIRVLVMDE